MERFLAGDELSALIRETNDDGGGAPDRPASTRK